MDWNYVKDKPVPRDGKKRTLAIYSHMEGISFTREAFCIPDYPLVAGKGSVIYAWSDEVVIPPPVKLPYKYTED